jgi:hypothetical protein
MSEIKDPLMSYQQEDTRHIQFNIINFPKTIDGLPNGSIVTVPVTEITAYVWDGYRTFNNMVYLSNNLSQIINQNYDVETPTLDFDDVVLAPVLDYVVEYIKTKAYKKQLKKWPILQIAFAKNIPIKTKHKIEITGNPNTAGCVFMYLRFLKPESNVVSTHESDCFTEMSNGSKFWLIMIIAQVFISVVYFVVAYVGRKNDDSRLKFMDPLLFIVYLLIFQYVAKILRHQTLRLRRFFLTLFQCVCSGISVYFMDKGIMPLGLLIGSQLTGAIALLMLCNLYFETSNDIDISHLLHSVEHSIPIAILTIVSFYNNNTDPHDESFKHAEVLSSSLFIWLWYAIYSTTVKVLFNRIKDKDVSKYYYYKFSTILFILTASEEILIAIFNTSFPILTGVFGIAKRLFIILVLLVYHIGRKIDKYEIPIIYQ